MKILLSPAKNIDDTKRFETSNYSIPVFQDEAEALVKKLQKLSAKKIAKLMNVSNDIAELNVNRYAKWSKVSDHKGGGVHAAAIFNGEVYRGLDALNLSPKALERAQEELRILSGLYGMLKPLDLIYPYRLEMGTSWGPTPAKKNLYAFWGDKVVKELNSEESELIVNLASAEYFKVLPTKKIKSKVITPTFKEFKNGKYSVVMVYAKQSRGAMARYILENNIHDLDGIKLFNVGGYQFDVKQSSDTEFVFTR